LLELSGAAYENLYSRFLANSDASHWATSARDIPAVHPATNGPRSGRKDGPQTPAVEGGRGRRRPPQRPRAAEAPRRRLLAAAGKGSEHRMRGRLRTRPWRQVGEAGPPTHHREEEAEASPPPHREKQGEVGRPSFAAGPRAAHRRLTQALPAAVRGKGRAPPPASPWPPAAAGGGGGEGPACHHATEGRMRTPRWPPPPASAAGGHGRAGESRATRSTPARPAGGPAARILVPLWCWEISRVFLYNLVFF